MFNNKKAQSELLICIPLLIIMGAIFIAPFLIVFWILGKILEAIFGKKTKEKSNNNIVSK